MRSRPGTFLRSISTRRTEATRGDKVEGHEAAMSASVETQGGRGEGERARVVYGPYASTFISTLLYHPRPYLIPRTKASLNIHQALRGLRQHRNIRTVRSILVYYTLVIVHG